jgi:ketosteroid isomerase-like protein
MSQENVENVRGGYEAFARGDLDAVLERLDSDVDWHPAVAPILGVETVRGKEAVRRFFTRDLFEGFDQFRACGTTRREPMPSTPFRSRSRSPGRRRAEGCPLAAR